MNWIFTVGVCRVGDACGLGGKLAEPEQKNEKSFQSVVEVVGPSCLAAKLFGVNITS
jgi:hypothetical protein